MNGDASNFPRTAGRSMNQMAPITAANARLPQTYESAKAALANCANIDECWDWADKAAALASYAKQADDDELMKMATRIRDRAIRRAGELLKQIEPSKGGRPSETRGATGPSFEPSSRKEAGEAAGMSDRQIKTAIRVANVPDEQFEKQVESKNPPTVTALAEQGKKAAPKPVLDLQGRDPDEFNRAMHYVGGWEDAAKDLAALNHEQSLPILNVAEVARLRNAIATIDAVTDRIITRI